MTTSHPILTISPVSHERTIARLRDAVRLFIGRSQLGPLNNYRAGDHGADYLDTRDPRLFSVSQTPVQGNWIGWR